MQAFYADRDARLKQFEDLKSAAEINEGGDDDENFEEKEYVPLSMQAFAEDWNESQFWVSESEPEIRGKVEGERKLMVTG